MLRLALRALLYMCVLRELSAVALSSSMRFLLHDMTAFTDLFAVAQTTLPNIYRLMQTGFYFWERYYKKKALMFAVALLASLLALR